MFSLGDGAKFWLYTKPTDMRKNFTAPRPTPAPSADDYERPPLPEEAPPAPPDLPPWEVPAPHRDKLDELVENAKQLDNFRIK